MPTRKITRFTAASTAGADHLRHQKSQCQQIPTV
jgi:hypothetical protein